MRALEFLSKLLNAVVALAFILIFSSFV